MAFLPRRSGERSLNGSRGSHPVSLCRYRRVIACFFRRLSLFLDRGRKNVKIPRLGDNHPHAATRTLLAKYHVIDFN